MTTLARWRAAKEAETGDKDRRPYLASECSDVSKCEKWRLEIIREISKKVAQIQNGMFHVRLRKCTRIIDCRPATSHSRPRRVSHSRLER